MRMSSNLLVLNLAICDLITPITSIPFDFALEENEYVWPFGRVLCKTLWPLATLSATAASLTLAMISFDRYRVIMHPFKQRLTSRQIKYSIAFTHTMGLLFVVPYVYHLDLAPSSHECVEAWPAFSYRQAYTLFLFIVQYGIPLAFMTIVYSITLLNLHGSSNKFESTPARERRSSSSDAGRPCHKISLQVDAIAANGDISGSRLDITRNYRKASRETIGQRHDVLGRDQNIRATKMFVTVVIVFATCRLPNEIFWLWSDFGDGHQSENSNIAGIICRMFTYTNSIFNPVIYWRFSKDFKKGFKAIFLSLCERKKLRIWEDDSDQDKQYHKISTLSESLSFVWRKISRSRSESSSYNPELKETQGHSRQNSANGRPSNGNVTFCLKENVLNKYGDAPDISRKKSSLKTSQSGVLPNQNLLFLQSKSKLLKPSEESIHDASEEVLKVKFRRYGTVLLPGKHAPQEYQTIIKITRPLSETDPSISEEDCANAISSTLAEVDMENSQPITEQALLSADTFKDSKDNIENINEVCKTQSADKEERFDDKFTISTSVENGNFQPTSESLLSSVECNDTFDGKKVSIKNIINLEACETKLQESHKENKHMFLGQLNLNLNLNGIKETNC